MAWLHRLNQFLERRWVTPAYAGLLLLGMNLFFFAAAVNSMAGWLYVITGIVLGLLVSAAILPPQQLRGLLVEREATAPVHVGDCLRLSLLITNANRTPRSGLQVIDRVPRPLWCPSQHEYPQQAIAEILPHQTYCWQYELTPPRRGIYNWQQVSLRTASPLGLFWCQRQVSAPQQVVIYPQVLHLQQCPLLDQLGQELSQEWRDRQHHLRVAHEGITRSLRPYRWGDPLRFVHWRTSARYGELRVREFDTFSGGNAITIALDTCSHWQEDDFEQAVIAAASLYVYSQQQQIPVQFWSPTTGIVRGQAAVLRTLAELQPQATSAPYPIDPILWLTPVASTLKQLPAGSVTLLWDMPSPLPQQAVLYIDRNRPLGLQLQGSLSMLSAVQ